MLVVLNTSGFGEIKKKLNYTKYSEFYHQYHNILEYLLVNKCAQYKQHTLSQLFNED